MSLMVPLIYIPNHVLIKDKVLQKLNPLTKTVDHIISISQFPSNFYIKVNVQLYLMDWYYMNHLEIQRKLILLS